MAYSDYEHCPGCDSKTIYTADVSVPEDVTTWHTLCLLKVIREAIEAHEPVDGYRQWYVSDLCIDCDAEEFWPAVEQAIRKAIS